MKTNGKANDSANVFNLQVNKTKSTCPIGQIVGKRNITQSKTPVFSCEGGCIRGEIARQAANFPLGLRPQPAMQVNLS